MNRDEMPESVANALASANEVDSNQDTPEIIEENDSSANKDTLKNEYKEESNNIEKKETFTKITSFINKYRKEKPKYFYLAMAILLIVFIDAISGDDTSKNDTTNTAKTIVIAEAQEDQVFESSELSLPGNPITTTTENINSSDGLDKVSADTNNINSDSEDGSTLLNSEEIDGILNGLSTSKNEDLTDAIQSETTEKISSLELEISVLRDEITNLNNYSNKEINELLKLNKQQAQEITSIKEEISQKRYDLGFEKDRPQIILLSTVPSPENCSYCVTHASFKYQDIIYQKGNGDKWNDFNVTISGNRMTLTKNDYVYDYWVQN